MNKITSINKYLIREGANKMIIHWLITDFCNYNCDYCLATERFLGKMVGEKELDGFIKTLRELKMNDPDLNIEVQLSGGEPTSNKILIKIVTEILKIRDTNIIIITNGSLLRVLEGTLGNMLKMKERILFLCSFHQHQTSKEKFNENILILKKLGFDYQITFLIPYDKTLKETKGNINFISKHHEESGKLFRLIIDGKEISNKYKKSLLDYYNSFTSINFDNQRYERDFVIGYSDNTERKIKNRAELNEVLFKNSNNRKYKGWTCYNFINNYHIVRPDGIVIFGGCDIFRNTDMEMNFYENFKLIDTPVVCTKGVCRCDSNMPTPKIYNKQMVNYYKRIDKILETIRIKLNGGFQGLSIDKIRIINNGVSNIILKINFKIGNNYIITSSEKRCNDNKGFNFIYKNYGINIKRNDSIDVFMENKKTIMKGIIATLHGLESMNISL